MALFTSPLFHVSGCHSTLVVGMLAGLKLVMPEGRFEPEDALELIQDERVNVWATVPTMVWRVCEHPDRHDYDTSSVVSVAFGGSPSADELQRKVRETFPNVKTTSNAYGLTESSLGGHRELAARTPSRKPTSVGPPVPTVEIQVIDGSTATRCRTGETGEICIKGPIIMAGYWNKPEATAETVVDGWLHTGDIGHLDDEGYLYITDRAKDMIIRGGENIYCVEIENRLVEHPAIADAAVIGVPHPELGEEVKAVVQVEPGATITEDEVKQWVADGLANFKVPAYVEHPDRQAPPQRLGQAAQERAAGRGRRLLRGDHVRTGLAIVLAGAVALAACGEEPSDEEVMVEAISASILEDETFTGYGIAEAEADCVAESTVTGLGVGRMSELGFGGDTPAEEEIDLAELDDDEVQVLARSMEDCIDDVDDVLVDTVAASILEDPEPTLPDRRGRGPLRRPGRRRRDPGQPAHHHRRAGRAQPATRSATCARPRSTCSPTPTRPASTCGRSCSTASRPPAPDDEVLACLDENITDRDIDTIFRPGWPARTPPPPPSGSCRPRS